jgi:hypothetical protein
MFNAFRPVRFDISACMSWLHLVWGDKINGARSCAVWSACQAGHTVIIVLTVHSLWMGSTRLWNRTWIVILVDKRPQCTIQCHPDSATIYYSTCTAGGLGYTWQQPHIFSTTTSAVIWCCERGFSRTPYPSLHVVSLFLLLIFHCSVFLPWYWHSEQVQHRPVSYVNK